MSEEEFTKAQSDNLPKVDSFMVAEFFANSSLYTSAEIRGIKAGRTIIVIAICLFPLTQLLDAVKLRNDIESFSNVLSSTAFLFTGLAKFMTIYLNRGSIKEILNGFEYGPLSPNPKIGGAYEPKCVKQCIIKTNTVSIGYIISVYLTITCSIAKSVLQRISSDDYRNWRVPIGSFTLFDITYSPNFEIACCIQTVLITISFTSIATCDVFISTILAHTATQYLLLQNRMSLMVKNACCATINDQENRNIFLEQSVSTWEHLREVLQRMVSYHNEINNVTRKFEQQFSYVILVQVLSTCVALCCAMYLWSITPVIDFKLFQYMVGSIALSFQVLLYCYWGNEVTFESQAVLRACYECDFVGTDLRFQKCLLLIMTRCQISQKLTAGKFTVLSLSTYVWIMRASYSTSMVLRNIQ